MVFIVLMPFFSFDFFLDPVVESQLNPNRSMITNRQIDLYNRAAYEQLYAVYCLFVFFKKHFNVFWFFFRLGLG